MEGSRLRSRLSRPTLPPPPIVAVVAFEMLLLLLLAVVVVVPPLPSFSLAAACLAAAEGKSLTTAPVARTSRDCTYRASSEVTASGALASLALTSSSAVLALRWRVSSDCMAAEVEPLAVPPSVCATAEMVLPSAVGLLVVVAIV